MANLDHEICSNCKFWEFNERENSDGIDRGICRRHAPAPKATYPLLANGETVEFVWVWPVTDEVDWCGEFSLLDTKNTKE